MTAQSAQALEIFYSYAHEDEELRSRLDKHLSLLRRQGLIADWHDRQIGAGKEWAKEINSHLETAHIILLLISADFLASDYCYSVEMQRALERHEAGEAHVIPVILRPVEWEREPSLHKLEALPTNAKPVTTWPDPPTYDSAFTDIVNGIRKVIEGYWRSPLGRSFKARQVWNVPFRRNPFFTGRNTVLDDLHEALTRENAAVLIHGHTKAISGLGGIGKTQTAVEYAYRYRDEYRAVLWARANSRETLGADFVSIADLLQISEDKTWEPRQAIEAVKHWLELSNDWLLILDNADELPIVRDFLPLAGKGHILLTTRSRPTGPIAQRIELDTLEPEEGALLLLRRAGILTPGASSAMASAPDRAEALLLVKELGGLPLAIDQAGAYLEETGSSLAHYRHLYETRRRDLLRRRGRMPTDHPEPVATTWSLSFQQVAHANPAAADLLSFCAFLLPDAIPEELITAGATELGEELERIAHDPLLLDEAIGELQRFSLLRRQTGLITVHRLVQAVLQDEMEESMRRAWARRATSAMVHACQLLIQQAEAVLRQPRRKHTDYSAQARSLLQKAIQIGALITPDHLRLRALKHLVRVAALLEDASTTPYQESALYSYSSSPVNEMQRGRAGQLVETTQRSSEPSAIHLQSNTQEGSITQYGDTLELHLYGLDESLRGKYLTISVPLGSLLEPVHWHGGDPGAIGSVVPINEQGALSTPLGTTVLRLSSPEDYELLEAVFERLDVHIIS